MFPQIDSHVKRLDEDLIQFAEDLKQGTVSVNLPVVDNICCNYKSIMSHFLTASKIPTNAIFPFMNPMEAIKNLTEFNFGIVLSHLS